MHTKPKILLVRNANSFDFGGGERYSIDLAIELKKLNYSPMIATRHKKITFAAKENDISTYEMPWISNQNFSGIRIVLIGFYFIWQMRLLFWYIKNIKNLGVDILHLQSRDDFIAGTLAGRLLRKKVIWTDHADLKYIFLNVKKIYKNPIGKLVYVSSLLTDKIIIVSKNENKLIKNSLQGLKLNNVLIIYNGVSNKIVKRSRNFSETLPVFSLTSRLVDSKGIRELLKASQELEKDGIKHKVLLIGEGPQELEYKNMAGSSVVFMGYPKNALSYVAGSDFFLHPTYNEGFSISLVEAAMLGKPVITTAVGGNTEIISHGETGILIKAMDSQALVDAMKYAINHKAQMQKLGNNLKARYKSEFNFEKIVKKQVLPLYN